MWSRFLYYVLQFGGVIVLTTASLLIVALLLMVMMREFAWNKGRHLLVMTLFFQMPGRYMVYLAANYLQLTFVLSTLLFGMSVQLSHLLFLLLLGVLQAVSIRQPVESARSFLGAVMLYAAFLIVDLLKTYIFDLRFDWRIAFVYFLLCAFLILYSVYFFLNSIRCLSARDVAEKKKRPRPARRHKSPGEEIGLIDLDKEDFPEDDTPGEEDI